VDAAAGNDANDGKATSRSWKTLARITSATFQPGDVVAFKRGQTWTGSATVAESGTASNPITLAAWGTGTPPTLTNPGQLNMLVLNGSYVRVTQLTFRAGVEFDNSDGLGISGPKYRGSGAVVTSATGAHAEIFDNEFTDVGIGVKAYGQYAIIHHNTFHDLRIAYRGPDSGTETSYGAVGVSVNNSNIEVAWNRFVNCRSTDSPYGADGGAVEVEGFDFTKDHLTIHHNFSSGSQGFLEVTESSSTDVELSYNVSDDYQQFIAFDTTTAPSNYRVLHNTVLRRSPLNTTSLFTVLYYREVVAVPAASWLNIRDNVFYADSEKVLRGSYSYTPYEWPHDHNLVAKQPDPIGYPLGAGDIIADPRFVQALPASGFVSDPAAVGLKATSAAVNLGATRSSDVDILGHPIPTAQASDAGAVEFLGAANPQPENPVILGAELLSDNGFEAQGAGPVHSPWEGISDGTGTTTVITGAPDAHGGNAYARIVGSAAGFTTLRRQVNVTPGSTYRLSLWVRTSSALCSSCVYYGVKTTTGAAVREFSAWVTPGWTQYTVEFTAPAAQVLVQIGYFGTSADRVEVDDWSLRQRT
jgi:hypothetical protein